MRSFAINESQIIAAFHKPSKTGILFGHIQGEYQQL